MIDDIWDLLLIIIILSNGIKFLSTDVFWTILFVDYASTHKLCWYLYLFLIDALKATLHEECANTSTKIKIMKKCAIMHWTKGRKRERKDRLPIKNYLWHPFIIRSWYQLLMPLLCICWRSRDRDSIVKCRKKPKHEGWAMRLQEIIKYEKIV